MVLNDKTWGIPRLHEKPLASHGLCPMQDADQDTVTWQITWVQYTAPFDETKVGGENMSFAAMRRKKTY
jgi:hypothetical protein